MRCTYCNHSETAPNPVDTGIGGGSVAQDTNLDKHLCTACSQAADKAVKNEDYDDYYILEEDVE